MRAALSLGIVAGIGAVGTTAYWTDSATLQGGTFTSGSIDLKLDGNLAGTGGTYSPVGFTVSDLIPGESYAWAVNVSNSGATPLSYKATGLASGAAGGLQDVMTFAVYAGAQNATTPAANSGSAATGNRVGVCSGGTPTPTQTFSAGLLSTSQTVVTSRPLAAAGSEWLCILATVPSSTGNAYQTKSVTAALTFTAAQVGQTP